VGANTDNLGVNGGRDRVVHLPVELGESIGYNKKEKKKKKLSHNGTCMGKVKSQPSVHQNWRNPADKMTRKKFKSKTHIRRRWPPEDHGRRRTQ